jgi:uncharacterized protein YdiU (UPF0061 family)
MKEKQITRAQKIAANNLKIYNNKYKVIDNNLSSLEAYSNLLIGIENTTNALVENTVHVLNEIKVIKDVEIPMEQLLRSTRAVTSKINKLMNYSNTVVEGIAETSSLFSEGLSEISQSKEKYHETVQKLNHFKSRSEELNQQFIEDVMDETEELLITMGEEKSHEKTQEDENVIDASFKEI